jgi:type VI secretion system protein ImpJ
MSFQIHWHEGLFLQPQHLQRMQKHLFDLTAAQRALLCPYPYGMLDVKIAPDDLEAMRMRFTRLRAIMPSGLEIDFPRNTELPSVDLKQAFSNSAGGINIYLAVPLYSDTRANTLDLERAADARTKLLYKVSEMECADENNGENSKPILVRRINARLMMEHEDRSDMEVLPLLRIVRTTNTDVSLPRQDPDYVPPCLTLQASPVLRDLMRDLSAQVEASRRELAIQMARGGFAIEALRGIQFEQTLRLRTLNRFSASLPSLVQSPSVSPFEIYLQLRELLGELGALYPDKDDFDVSAYNHDHPLPCFRELSTKIRGYLRGSVAPSYIKVPFVQHGPESLSANFLDEHFSRPSDYFLGIKTKEDPRALASFVEDADAFKLMPRSLEARAIRGVTLKEERNPPLELPAQSNLHFFRLLRGESQRIWGQIQLEKASVIRWKGKIDPDYEITLYMTLPSGGETP